MTRYYTMSGFVIDCLAIARRFGILPVRNRGTRLGISWPALYSRRRSLPARTRGTTQVRFSYLYGCTEMDLAMRKVPYLPAACVALAFFVAMPERSLLAQDDDKPAVAPLPRTINLTQEQRYIIKENVKDMPLQKAPPNAPETIGDMVPANIKLYSLPSLAAKKVAQAQSHMFFVKEGNQAIFLVSPEDRRIADVIH